MSVSEQDGMQLYHHNRLPGSILERLSRIGGGLRISISWFSEFDFSGLGKVYNMTCQIDHLPYPLDHSPTHYFIQFPFLPFPLFPTIPFSPTLRFGCTLIDRS